jgi:SAM-dependent methyltransferase
MEPLTRASPTYPIAVMSFDRPQYLESVLRSLRAQTVPIAATEIFLFQDGYRSRNGHDLTDPRRVARCMELFETIFPGSKTFCSTENLGVAFNFARAENHFFEELGTSAAFFFEDDLILSPHYLTALYALTAIALQEKRIAYIAAYGDHRASLAEQKSSANKLILMRHKWGFALTRRQWLAQRDILAPYLEILATADYRRRDHTAIRQYFKKLGFGSNGTSQDGMKDVASCVLGTVKIMSSVCFGKYIGENGLHSDSRLYQDEGYGQTSMFPGEISSFETPSGATVDKWVVDTRAEGKKVLRSMKLSDLGQLRPEPQTQPASNGPPDPKPKEGKSDSATENVVRALYQALLFREPDPTGLDSALRQLQSGKSIEDLMRWCLRSPEFAAKIQRFIETYIGPQAAPAPGQSPVPLRYVPLDAPAMRVECHASTSELAQLIHRIGEAWTSMGSTRPFYSVLSAENFLPENINKEAMDTFWVSGSKETTRIQSILMKHGFDSAASKICVEYGCGVGRVTSPLARMFKEVYAYDVSSTHLEIARARAESPNIEFVLCTHNIFRTGLQKCDFFYSNIVLQHNPPPLIQKLISIALEALRPGGIAIFQVPTYASGYSFSIREYLDRQKHHDMEMHVFPQPEIFALIKAASCELQEIREDGNIGRVGQWISNTFVVRRPRSTVGFESGKHGA